MMEATPRLETNDVFILYCERQNVLEAKWSLLHKFDFRLVFTQIHPMDWSRAL